MAKAKKKSKASSNKKNTMAKKNVSSKTSLKAHLNTINKHNARPHEVLSYSCIKRYYIIENTTTGTQNKKRMWIVIGDGHKWYRKFDTQAEAINYFRNLKKYAKMRIQSVKSKSFIKTVYTFLLMEEQGVNVKEIIRTNKNKNIQYDKEDETNDFEDEFSQFDVVDNDYDNFDQEEVNKIIAEKEKDIVVVDSTQEVDELITLNREIKAMNQEEEEKDDEVTLEKTILIKNDEINEPKEEFNGDLYELSQESLIKNTNVDNQTTNNASYEKTNNEINNLFKDNHTKNNDISTQAENIPIEDTIKTTINTSKSKTFLYWVVIIFVALILAGALAVGVYFAATK